MRKRVFALAVMLICLSILASTTLAYFTDIGLARNVITTGAIKIEVVEQQLVDGKLEAYPSEPIKIMPGKTVSKVVSVGSKEQPAWIRANYTVTVMDAQGKAMDIPADELAKVVLIQTNSDKWTAKDGWFYYADALGGGATTEKPLFQEVRFSGPHMDNKYQNCSIVITVNAQAVQYANNGTSAQAAAGWPTT